MQAVDVSQGSGAGLSKRVWQVLAPVGMQLLQDKTAQVRDGALHLH